MPASDAEIRRSHGRRLAAARRQAGWTQVQLADKLTAAGCPTTSQSVSLWEKGTTAPTPSRQVAVADVLGYPWRDLFDHDNVLPDREAS